MHLSDITSSYRSRLIIETYNKLVQKGDRVLDVGCGNGVVSAILAQEFRIKIVGCDMMRYLTRAISFVQMEKEDRLPFRNNAFDVIFFNDVLHHTPRQNQEKLILESLRVAKKVLIFEVEPTIIGIIVDFFINKIHNLHQFLL